MEQFFNSLRCGKRVGLVGRKFDINIDRAQDIAGRYFPHSLLVSSQTEVARAGPGKHPKLSYSQVLN